MALLVLVWGYAWVASKVALAYVDAFDFAFLRVVVGAASLAAILVATGRSLRPVHWRGSLMLGLLQVWAFLTLNTWALSGGGAGKISVLTFTMPFWVLLLAWPVLGERLRGLQWPASALALAGLVAILEPWRLEQSLQSKALAVLGGATWAAGTVLSKRLESRTRADALAFTFWQMVVGAVPLGVVAWVVPGRTPDWTWELGLSLLFCGALATGLGWYMWLYVLHRLPAGTTSLSSLGIPAVAVAASAAQLGEHLSAAELAGIVAVALALGLNSLESGRRAARGGEG